jgi:uncharacterized protein (TIGR02444 family)
MTDADKPTDPIASGNDLPLAGPHWTFITRLYGSPDVQQACLLLQDHFDVDVSFLLTLLWYARNGIAFDDGDVEALDGMIASWRSDVVRPVRTIRREIKPIAEHNDAIARFHNKIKSVEVEAEQIEIALLVHALEQRLRPQLSGEAAQPAPIARTIETAVAFYATRAGVPAGRLEASQVQAAINIVADAAANTAVA